MSGINIQSSNIQQQAPLDLNPQIQDQVGGEFQVQVGNQQGQVSIFSRIKDAISNFFQGIANHFRDLKVARQGEKALSRTERAMDQAVQAFTQIPRDLDSCLKALNKAHAQLDKLLPGDQKPIAERFIESLLSLPNGESRVLSLATDKGAFVDQLVLHHEANLRKLAFLQEQLSAIGIDPAGHSMSDSDIQRECEHLRASLNPISQKAKEHVLESLNLKMPNGVKFDESGQIHGSTETRSIPLGCRFIDQPELIECELAKAIETLTSSSIAKTEGTLTNQALADIGRQNYSIPDLGFSSTETLENIDDMSERTRITGESLLQLAGDENTCKVLSSVLTQSHLRFLHDCFAKEDGSATSLYFPSKVPGRVDLGDGGVRDLGILKNYGGAKFELRKIDGQDGGDGGKIRVDIDWEMACKGTGSGYNREEFPLPEDGVLLMHLQCSYEIDLAAAARGELDLSFIQYPKATFSGKLDL